MESRHGRYGANKRKTENRSETNKKGWNVRFLYLIIILLILYIYYIIIYIILII